NKMDLVDYDSDRFDAIVADYRAFADDLGIGEFEAVPVSALKGDNVFVRSAHTPWYAGRTLMEALEAADTTSDLAERPFRLPVQWVNRPNAEFRGFSGLVVSGTVRPGDKVTVLPGDRRSTVTRVVTADGDLAAAGPAQSVTLTLADEIDVSRGDVIAEVMRPPEVTDQVSAHIIWMHDTPLLPGRQYLFKAGTRLTAGQVTRIVHAINVNTLEQVAARTLALNGIARCHVAFDRDLAVDPYVDNRDTGSFIIIDRYTNETVGAGMIEYGLRRATNIHWQSTEVNKSARAALNGQVPAVVWFTGLSGSGKSTVANIVEKKLHAAGRHTYLLDGDNVRHGLNRDLGFTDQDRVENVRRVGEVAALFADAGLIVLVSFISPFRSERQMARACVGEGEFIEVFMDTPLEVCEARDPKGLYKKARAGALANFTGIDSPYEPPQAAEIRLDGGSGASAEELADQVIAQLEARGHL
ncbi:MAG: adenylyl-sulfate kinase, partial [Rhodospirillaceae bacterium]|nr:adenylyl-sulfate kinase [Rhodospirillaceae bacterium]